MRRVLQILNRTRVESSLQIGPYAVAAAAADTRSRGASGAHIDIVSSRQRNRYVHGDDANQHDDQARRRVDGIGLPFEQPGLPNCHEVAQGTLENTPSGTEEGC